jgi:lipopolysaccharide transport system permease protein
VLSGIFLWQTFVDGLTAPMQNLKQQSYFLSIVPAPYDGIIISTLFNALLNLFIRLLVLLCSLIIFRSALVIEWILIPLGFSILLMTGFSLGLALAPAILLYDDIGHLVGMFATFGIFVVPVIYPLPQQSLLAANPLALVMEATRAWMLGSYPLTGLLPAIAIALVVFPLGWILLALSRTHLAGRPH